MSERNENKPEYRRILYGQNEPIFQYLSERVRDNFRSPASENALLWNTFYPRRLALEMQALQDLKPLWGTRRRGEEERLEPYFWGTNTAGERLQGLDEVLAELDGPGQKTEVDLFLVGDRSLVAVEAKNRSTPGRCSRFLHNRCPEIHPDNSEDDFCRYWEHRSSLFVEHLEFGSRPVPGDDKPPCARWYQLARTLLAVVTLAGRLDLNPQIWMVVSRKHWPSIERDWLAFTELIRADRIWRTARVLSWRAVQQLPSR